MYFEARFIFLYLFLSADDIFLTYDVESNCKLFWMLPDHNVHK